MKVRNCFLLSHAIADDATSKRRKQCLKAAPLFFEEWSNFDWVIANHFGVVIILRQMCFDRCCLHCPVVSFAEHFDDSSCLYYILNGLRVSFALNSESVAVNCEGTKWEPRATFKIIMKRMKMALTVWSFQGHAQRINNLESIFALRTIFGWTLPPIL